MDRIPNDFEHATQRKIRQGGRVTKDEFRDMAKDINALMMQVFNNTRTELAPIRKGKRAKTK